ncbi:MAG: hypothetical protein QOI76_3462 [Frankiales bacterium]|nr:hypothetical protein [Frankiales bacterium]
MNPRTQLAVAAAGVTLLSSTALHAVFLDTGWVAPVVGAVLAVLAGAELGSRLGQHLVARAVWRFVGSGLGTLFYITAVWAHEGAVLGFIPRGHTWHLLRLTYAKAFDEVHNLATPAPTYKALMLLTATGVALVAIAVDQLSVRAPLIGLPLLALYSVPEWLSKDGTGWVPLALGGGGYVGLLIREGRDRTSRWGRTVTGATTLGRNRSAAGAMSQAGWRIGAVALGTALVVPPLIPDLGHFNLAKGGGVAPSAVVHYNLTANLAGSLHSTTKLAMYSYIASGPPANSQGEYLRMAASDSFNSNGFIEPTPAPDPGVDPTTDPLLPDGVNPPAGTPTMTTQIVVTAHFGQQELPIPVGTTQIENLQGQWSYEQVSATVFSADSEAVKNQGYKTTSNIVNLTPQALEKSVLTAADRANRALDLVVPGNLPTKVAALAKSVTAKVKARTDYEKAVALQDWFNDPANFRYSLNGPSGGKNYQALVDFLTVDRKGYCQQFSSAMAIMARTLGIPARVAFGFTTGVLRPGTMSTFDVDNQDAHAWPELYFSGLGWVRFEPTPRADQTIKPDYTLLGVGAIQNLGKSGATVTAPTGRPTTTIKPKAPVTDNPNNHQGRVGSGSGGFSLPVTGDALVWSVVLVVLLLSVGSLPLLQSNGRRRRHRHGDDPRSIALLAWRETLRDAYDLGYPTSVADSPRQTARRLTESASLSNTAAGALHRLARAVELARYAPIAGDPRGLLFDAATVSAAMYGAAPRRAKLRARMLPRSTTQALGESMSRMSNRASRQLSRGADRLLALTNRVLGRTKPSSPATPPTDHTEAKELVRR